MTTNDVVMATNADDSRAIDTLREQHAEIIGMLTAAAEGVRAAAASAGPEFDEAFRRARDLIGGGLTGYLESADEAVYSAARGVASTRVLADANRAVAPVLDKQIRRLVDADERPQAIAAAEAVLALVEARLGVEDEILLPALATERDVDLAGIASRLPATLGSAPATAPHGDSGSGHAGCSCGEHDSAEAPELDVRSIPHAIRHATVFGAFDAVPAGGSMVLIAPHDPVPLLHQLAERSGGRLEVSYEERGPEAWRLRLARV